MRNQFRRPRWLAQLKWQAAKIFRYDLNCRARCAAAAIRASGLFDAHFYRKRYEDVSLFGSDPFVHYILYGMHEERQPGPAFDPAAYLATHTDAAGSDRPAILHYLSRHQGQERACAPAPRLPNFLCIGAQRSGTSWLHANLSQHPDIWLPPVKEIHYFDEIHGSEPERWGRFRRDALQGVLGKTDEPGRLRWMVTFALSKSIDDAWYASLFESAPTTAKVGEVTPAYAILPTEGITHIRRLMPQARILFLMRNPVERMVSGAVHELTTARGHATAPTLDAVLEEMTTLRCLSRSGYRRTIEAWEAAFGPSALACLFFDDIQKQPQAVLEQACQHIGVAFDPGYFTAPSQLVNQNLPIPSTMLEAAYRRAAKECLDELKWLAARFGGPASGWLERATHLIAPP